MLMIEICVIFGIFGIISGVLFALFNERFTQQMDITIIQPINYTSPLCYDKL
jgi:ABC-type lipoprotein release transport system permease subunit